MVCWVAPLPCEFSSVANRGCAQMLTEKHEADWYKMRSITQQNNLDGASSRSLKRERESTALTDWCRVLDNCGVGGYGLHGWYV